MGEARVSDSVILFFSVLDRRGILQQEESTAQEESCPRGPSAQEPTAAQGAGGQAEESGAPQKDGSLPHLSAVSDSLRGGASGLRLLGVAGALGRQGES